MNKINLLLAVLLLGITSCKDETEEKRKAPFHITYGLPEDLTRAGGIVEFDDITILVIQNGEGAVNIVGVDGFGNDKWSKEISCPSENGLIALAASKLDEGRFLLSGNLATDRPVLIEMSKDGTVEKSHKLSTEYPLDLTHCTVNADGTRLYSGRAWNGMSFEGFAVRANAEGNISWSRRFPDYPHIAAAGQTGQYTFALPQFQQAPNRQPILKLDQNGNLTQATEAFKDGDFMTSAGLILRDNLYVILTEWNSASFYLLKINPSGETVSSLQFPSAEYPALTTDGSSLFLTVTVGSALTVLELDGDLMTRNQKTMANVVGGNAFAVTGITSVSQQAISSIVLPSDTDPTYGMKGVNLIRIFRSDWQTRCQVTEYGAASISPSFLTESLDGVTMESIEIEKASVEIEVRNLQIRSQSVCD
jgi:hypothetical protein